MDETDSLLGISLFAIGGLAGRGLIGRGLARRVAASIGWATLSGLGSVLIGRTAHADFGAVLQLVESVDGDGISRLKSLYGG